MDDSPEPDSSERYIRFGCGFLAASLIAFVAYLSASTAFSGVYWAKVFGVALIFGLLAVRFGDRAWRGLVRLLSWFDI